MTTLNDLLQETRRRALSDMREEINLLAANMGSGDTTFSLASGQQLNSIQPGALVEIDQELILILGVAGTSVTSCVRGWYDSTATTHSANAVITVNPRFPQVDVIKAINEDIDDLSAPTNGLFQAKECTLSYNPVIVGYDMTDVNTNIAVPSANLIDLIEVRIHDYGPFQRWPLIPLSKVKIQRQADTTVFPSGIALQFYAGGYPGRPIRVQYKSPYTTPLVNTTDDVQAVTGLHTQAHDIPVLGATYRLMQFRELKRSFTEAQPEARRAEEVPVGSSLTSMKGIMAHRKDRIDAERTRLKQMYPVRYK